MTASKILRFDPHHRLLAKAQDYCTDIHKLVDASQDTIEVLVKALWVADDAMKLQIMLVLGTLGRPEAIQPLYRIMKTNNQNEIIRQAAAVQLNMAASMVTDAQTLVHTLVGWLITDLSQADPFDRSNAVIALGWKGNSRAVLPLIKALDDNDTQVQQAAVVALANMKDNAVFPILVTCLKSGSKERQQALLDNLWRFTTHRAELAPLYLEFIHHPDPELRFDALNAINRVAPRNDRFLIYTQCLRVPDDRIRELALNRLAAIHCEKLSGLKKEITLLVTDLNPKVRQAALKLLHRIQSTPVISNS